jgi:hypothetical protein
VLHQEAQRPGRVTKVVGCLPNKCEAGTEKQINEGRKERSLLVTWEAEMGRIAIRGQAGQMVLEPPHLKIDNQSKMDWR